MKTADSSERTTTRPAGQGHGDSPSETSQASQASLAIRSVVVEANGSIGTLLQKGRSVAAHSKAVLDEADVRQAKSWDGQGG